MARPTVRAALILGIVATTLGPVSPADAGLVANGIVTGNVCFRQRSQGNPSLGPDGICNLLEPDNGGDAGIPAPPATTDIGYVFHDLFIAGSFVNDRLTPTPVDDLLVTAQLDVESVFGGSGPGGENTLGGTGNVNTVASPATIPCHMIDVAIDSGVPTSLERSGVFWGVYSRTGPHVHLDLTFDVGFYEADGNCDQDGDLPVGGFGGIDVDALLVPTGFDVNNQVNDATLVGVFYQA